MKKILLLSFMGTCFFSSFAQQTGNDKVNRTTREKMVPFAKEAAVNIKPNIFQHAKTTGVPFVTETFASGTTTNLPTGWTAGSVGVPAGATWKWRMTATTGAYSIGVINSTTASNGWMVYDSDSIGAAYPTANPFEGWLQSPSYSCVGHSTVQLAFQEHFRRFNDSCFVDVSNNNGVNWTRFPVTANNNISSNSYLQSNPYTAKINITSVAANQPNVIIRFWYKCSIAQGGYNWIVDDMTLSELDPVDMSLNNAGIIMTDGAGGITSFGSIPLQLVDTVIPVATVSNDGSTAPANIAVNAKIFNGTSQVYNQTNTLSSLATGFQDSIVEFPTYVPTSIGNYTATFSINPTGDVSPGNNDDTTDFSVTQYIYDRFGNNVQGSYYVHRPAGGGNIESSFSVGTAYTIPVNKEDSLYTVEVAFSNSTTVGSKVVANIYKFQSSTWTLVANTVEKTLTAADISPASGITFTKLPIVGALSPFKMDAGDYAVVVVGNGIPAASTVLVLYSNEATPEFYDILHGIGDTSLNDGITGFASSGLPFSMSGAPLIRLNMEKPLGVNDVNALSFVGNAYPNPAKTQVMIPFTTSEAAEVNVTIANTLGQTVKSTNAGKYTANQKGKVVFSVSDLSSGVYFYTVEANGQRITKRMVVTH
jgi:hypothetical protein